MLDWEKGVRLYRMSAMDFEAVDMTPPELLDSNNLGIMSLGVFQGSLFAGTVNYQDGFTLIRYDSPNATEDGPVDYSLLTTNGFGYPDNGYVWRMQVFDYALFLGVFNSGNAESPPHDGRAQLWYSTDGEIFLPLVTDGFDDPWDEGVRTMAAWNDRLCVGTASSIPRSVFPGTPGGLRILVSQPAP
jgi:hypothetical protein